MKVRSWSVRPDLRLTAHAVAGRYRLDDLLGRGGAADVYEGLDLRLRRPVAVKLFRPDGDSLMEERFGGEGRLLARMRHPGLVTVYDTGREEGRPYLVMQLVRGTTLRRRIAEAPLTPGEAVRTGAALASALAHVHAAGVVHRDVKPSNILLDETGAPHLADFGISRSLDTTRADTGPLVGTAAYLAPEQVLGRGAGPAADVYSLGLVLLESLKGELEYAGAPLEAALARLHRPPVVPPGFPADLAELVEAMTDADETGRPDADTCFRTLTALGDGYRASPPPHGPGLPERTRRSGGPSRATAPVAGVRSPAPSSSAPRRPGRALAAGATLAVLGAALTGSIGGPTGADGGDVPRAPRQNVAEPPAARQDRTAGSPTAPTARQEPASPPATAPASRTAPSPAAGETAARPGPATSASARPRPGARGKDAGPRKGVARGHGRDGSGRPAGAGPPAKHRGR
ncbi:protein kinase [Streptomyces sp. NPDC001744]|uniref:serine/threonine-protein kinase n=1 Tax=Streptomyces sp. NPDC001744 TaxID=3364606 RepID=UPI00369A69DC